MKSKRLKRCQRAPNHKLLGGAKFSISFDYSNIDESYSIQDDDNTSLDVLFSQYPTISFLWKSEKHRDKKDFPDIILNSIKEKLAWFNNGINTQRLVSISGYTEIRCPPTKDKLQRKRIRANPDYRGNGLWTDWVNVSWALEEGVNVTLPAQVLMILDFDSVIFEDIPINIRGQFPFLLNEENIMEHDVRQGVQLLVHSASENAEEQYEFSIVNRFHMEPYLHIIDLENITDIVFVTREIPSVTDNPISYTITRVAKSHMGTCIYPPNV
jgi:hypothetical protein